ncbi:Rpn family recombination-promoting nuclease/putative transposase [Neomoorella thermoacetica]|uniref:Rpn family recombination-promoting nuclease/putative transposase n=1 Tax=Neomoorella thermoacetica TaxID=1525 RepID=UPI0008FAE521|nr:Rpn family recombination-promoting nuclease/putative transposase [Moorella thermoacetica]OIQ53868.1 putative transposase [Moorella thermoacetica]
MPENEGQPRPPYHPHDKGYRQLLSDKRVFLELLKTFVRETWVEAIDEKDLILVNKSYVLQDFSEKEADIVYRLKTKDRNVIFYVLLELQSTVDYLIPFRLLLYMVEIWREIYTNTPQHERESKHFRLPPIIPAVLYNGAGSWTAALSLQKLAGVLRRLTPDEFRHITSWLKNVVKPRMPEGFKEKVDRILDASNPWEVERMIYNLELTLEEMQRQALLKGKMEVAKNLLRLGIELDKIAQATELSPKEIATLKKQLEQ